MPTEHSPDLLVRALFIAPAERATARLRRLLSEPTRRRVAVEAVADVDEAAAALAAGVADCAVCLHDPPLVDGTEAVAELAAATGSKPVFAAAPLSEAGAALDAGATEVLPIDDGTIVHDVSVARLERCVADAQAAAASSPDPDILSALSSSSPDYSFLLDDDGRYLEVLTGRRSDERLFTDEELVGSTVEDLLDDESAGTIRGAIDEALATGQSVSADYRIDVRGVTRWYEGLVTPVGDADGDGGRVLLTARGITERKDREHRLVDARDQLRQTLERVSDGFFAITTDWEVTYVNSSGDDVLRRVMHVDDDGLDLVGENLLDHAPEAVESRFYDEFTRSMETQTPVTIEDRYDPIDGWFSVNAYPSESGLSVYFSDISERKRREQELELKTRALETAPIGMTITDPTEPDNPLVYVNERFESVTGYDAEDAVGRNCRFLQGAETDPAAVAELRRAVATRESTTVELRNYTADGDPFWNEVIVAPVFDDDGDLLNYTGFQRDVTRRKERERTLGHLVDVTRRFQRVETRDELIDHLVDAVEEVFGYEYSIVRLHDPAEGVLRPERASPAMQSSLSSYPPLDEVDSPSGRVFTSGEPEVFPDLVDLNGRDYGPIDSGMVLPLGDHGVVSVGSPESHSFDAEDAALVELLARTAASALDRIDRQAEMRRLQRVVDHVDEKAFLLDADGRFSFVTDRLSDYLDHDGDLVGTSFSAVVAPEDADRAAAAVTAVRDGPAQLARTVETAVHRPGGLPIAVEYELVSVGGDDHLGTVAGVCTDISELAETREDLRRERDRFRQLFEHLPDPVVEVDLSDGEPRVEDANPAFDEVFGSDGPVARGALLNEAVVPAESMRPAEGIDDRVVAGEAVTTEVRRRARSGDLDFLFRGFPYTQDGRQHAFAVYTDITERRERERYLQILNRVLRHNLRNDLNVVLGLGERIRAAVDDPDLRDAADTLATKAQKATTLSEKAKRIEQVLGARGGDTEVLDLEWHLRRVADEQRARFPEARVTVDCPGSIPVEVNQDVDVARALTELAENALEHAVEPTPSLHVRVDPPTDPGEPTAIRFVDDGPGIPDTEWAVITGDQEISQLSHASGLGLWLTRWLVDAHDGRLSLERSGDSGSTVVLELPTAPPE